MKENTEKYKHFISSRILVTLNTHIKIFRETEREIQRMSENKGKEKAAFSQKVQKVLFFSSTATTFISISLTRLQQNFLPPRVMQPNKITMLSGTGTHKKALHCLKLLEGMLLLWHHHHHHQRCYFYLYTNPFFHIAYIYFLLKNNLTAIQVEKKWQKKRREISLLIHLSCKIVKCKLRLVYHYTSL